MHAGRGPDADLFCRVIDNFGDAGVCWRLARALATDHGWRIRLWIDAPEALARIKPGGWDEGGIEVRQWTKLPADIEPAACVIEAFACELPRSYIDAMAARPQPPRWFNLEYLSAEDWVEGCHGLASRDPATGLAKHFFFPGFTPRTGGLLRERDLFARRDAWRGDGALQQATFARLGMQPDPGALQLSLFSYESPAIATLLDALAAGSRPAQLWVPEGRALAAIEALYGRALRPGEAYRRGALDLRPLRFMDQDDYDALLWHADLNIVRGEDSFVRAQWAARPLLWHIYRQQDDAHLVKLDAFLDRLCADLDPAPAQALRAAHAAWNRDLPLSPGGWQALFLALPALQKHAEAWATRLARQPDLASQLVSFNQTPI